MDALRNGLSLVLYILLLFSSIAHAQSWTPCTWPADTLPSAVNINHMKKDITEYGKQKDKINIRNENEHFSTDNIVANQVSERDSQNNLYGNGKNYENHVKVDTNVINAKENRIGDPAYTNAGNEMYKGPCVYQNDNSYFKYVNPYGKPYVNMLSNLVYFKPLEYVSSIWPFSYNGIYNMAPSNYNNGVRIMEGYYTYKWLLPTNRQINSPNLLNYTVIGKTPYYIVNQNENNQPVARNTVNFDKDINHDLRQPIISAIGFTNNRNGAICNVDNKFDASKQSYIIKTRPILFGQKIQTNSNKQGTPEAFVNYRPMAKSKNFEVPIEVNTKYETSIPDENKYIKVNYLLTAKQKPEETNNGNMVSEQSKDAFKINLSTASAYFEPTVSNSDVQMYTMNGDLHPQNLKYLSGLNFPYITSSSNTKNPITFNVKPIIQCGFEVYANNKGTTSSTNKPQMNLSNEITFDVKPLSGSLYDTAEYLGNGEIRFLNPGVILSTHEPKIDIHNEVAYNIKPSASQYSTEHINNKLNAYFKPGAILHTNKFKMDSSNEDTFHVKSMPTSEFSTVLNSNNEPAKYFNADTVLKKNEPQMDSSYEANYVVKPILLPTSIIPQMYKYDGAATDNGTLKSKLPSQVKISPTQSITPNKKDNLNLNNDVVTYNVNNKYITCQRPYFIKMKPIEYNQMVPTYDFGPETQNLQLLYNNPTVTNYNPLIPIGFTESGSIIPETCKKLEGKYFLHPNHNLSTSQQVVTPTELVKNNELPINRKVESQPTVNVAKLIPGTTPTSFVPSISNPYSTCTSKLNPGPAAVYFEPKISNVYPQKSRLLFRTSRPNLDLSTTSPVKFVPLSSLNVLQMSPNNNITFNIKPLIDDTEGYSNDKAIKYPNPNRIFITNKPQKYPSNKVIYNIKGKPGSECGDDITKNVRHNTKLSPNNFEIGPSNGVNYNFKVIPKSEYPPEVNSNNKATEDSNHNAIFKTYEPQISLNNEATFNIKPMHGILRGTENYLQNGVTKYLEPTININYNDVYKVKHIPEIGYSTENYSNNGDTRYLEPDRKYSTKEPQKGPSNELTDSVKPIPENEYGPKAFSSNKAPVFFYPGAILNKNKHQDLSNQIIYNNKYIPGQQYGVKAYSNKETPVHLYPSAISNMNKFQDSSHEMIYVKPILEKQHGTEVYPHFTPESREPSKIISVNAPPIIPNYEDISVVSNYLIPQTFENKQALSNYDARMNLNEIEIPNEIENPGSYISSYYENSNHDKPGKFYSLIGRPNSEILQYVHNSKGILTEPKLGDDYEPFKGVEPDYRILNRGVGVTVPIENAFFPSYLKTAANNYNQNIVTNYGPSSFIQPIYEGNKKEKSNPLLEPVKTMSGGHKNVTFHTFNPHIRNISEQNYPTQEFLTDPNLPMENFNTFTIIKEAPVKYYHTSKPTEIKIPNVNYNHVVPVTYTTKTNQPGFENYKYTANKINLLDQTIPNANSTPCNDEKPIQIDEYSLNIRKTPDYSVPMEKNTNIPITYNDVPIRDSYKLKVKEPAVNYNQDTFDPARYVNQMDYKEKYRPTGVVHVVSKEVQPFINYAPLNKIQDNLNKPYMTIKHGTTSEFKPELGVKNHYSPETSTVTPNTEFKERSDSIYIMEDKQNSDVIDDIYKEKGYNEQPLFSTRRYNNFELNEVTSLCPPINGYNAFANTNPKFYEYDKDNTPQNNDVGKIPYAIQNPSKFGRKIYNKNPFQNYQIINQMGDETKSNEIMNDSDLNGNGEMLEDMTPTCYKLSEIENKSSPQYEGYLQPKYMPYNFVFQKPTNSVDVRAKVPGNLIHTKTLDYKAQPVTTFKVTPLNNRGNNNGDIKRFDKGSPNNPTPKATDNFNNVLQTIKIQNPCGKDVKAAPQNYEDLKLMKLNKEANESPTDATAASAYGGPVFHYVRSPFSVNAEPTLNENESQTEPNYDYKNTELKDSTGILNYYNPRRNQWKYQTTAECSLNAAVSNNLRTINYPIINNKEPGKDTFKSKVDYPTVQRDVEKPLRDKDNTQYFTPCASRMTHVNNIPITYDIEMPNVPSPQYIQEKVSRNTVPIGMFKRPTILNTGPITNDGGILQSTSMPQKYKIGHIGPVQNYEAGSRETTPEFYDNKEQAAIENNNVNDPKFILTNKDNIPRDFTYFLSNGRNNFGTKPQVTRTAVNGNNSHISHDTSFEVKNDFCNNAKNKAVNDCYKTLRPECSSALPTSENMKIATNVYTRPEIEAYKQYFTPAEVKLNDESNTNQREKTDSNVFLNDLQLSIKEHSVKAPNILPSMDVKNYPSTPIKAYTGPDHKLPSKETRSRNNNRVYLYDPLKYYQNYETTSSDTYNYSPQLIRDEQNNIQPVNNTTARIVKGIQYTHEYKKSPCSPENVDANIKYSDKAINTPNFIQETAEKPVQNPYSSKIVPQPINSEPNFVPSIPNNYQIRSLYAPVQPKIKESTMIPTLQDLSNQKLDKNALIGENYGLSPYNYNIPVSSKNQMLTCLETLESYKSVNNNDIIPKPLIKMPEVMEGESNLLHSNVNDITLNYKTCKSPMISKLMNYDNNNYKTEMPNTITGNVLPKTTANFMTPTLNMESRPVFKNMIGNTKTNQMPVNTEAVLEYQEMPQNLNDYQNKPVNPGYLEVPVKSNTNYITEGIDNTLNIPNKQNYITFRPYIDTNNVTKAITVCNKTLENQNTNNDNNLRVQSNTNAIRASVNFNVYSYKDPNQYKNTLKAWAGTNQESNSLKVDDVSNPNTIEFPEKSYSLYSSLNFKPKQQPYNNNIQDSPLVKDTGRVSTLPSSFDTSNLNSIPLTIRPSSFDTIQSKPSKSSLVSQSLNVPNLWYSCVSTGQFLTVPNIGLRQTVLSTPLPVALDNTFNPYQYISPTERSNSLQSSNLTPSEKPPSVSTESLKNSLVNYLNTNEIKNSLYYNPRSITIPLGNLGIAKHYPQVNEKYFTVKTDNDDINLKAWYSKLKVVKATITFETNETDVLNFLPIVKNKAKYNPNEIQKTAKDAVSKVYGEPIVVNGVYSQAYPYAIVSNVNDSFKNGRCILLWPTFCDCGCQKAGCQCFWDQMSNNYYNPCSL